jgi:hypothetical protein
LELDILVNRLEPINREAKEKTIRELSFLELVAHAHYMGVIDKLEKDYSTMSDDSLQLFELIQGIRVAVFSDASRGKKLIPGDTHFTGVRREHGKAVWVERQPNFKESIEAMALKLQFPGPD